jgi:Glyoxalase-like domain
MARIHWRRGWAHCRLCRLCREILGSRALEVFAPLKPVEEMLSGPAIQIVFDAANPNEVAEFWRKALDYKLQDPPSGFESWQAWLDANGLEDNGDVAAVVDPDGTRPRIYIQRVPEPKTVKNRLHLDISVDGARGCSPEERRSRLEAEADRLLSFGARKVEYRQDEHGSCIVMQDPEGNEFCLH